MAATVWRRNLSNARPVRIQTVPLIGLNGVPEVNRRKFVRIKTALIA
jgi:hypothetical protein